MDKELFSKIEKLITEIRELESELEKWNFNSKVYRRR